MDTIATNAAPQKKWLRTEARTVRPFRYSENLLQKTGFRLYPGDDFIETDSIQKDEIEIDKLHPEIRFDFSPASLTEQLGLTPDQVRLIVSIEDRALKQTLLAVNLTIAECAASEIVAIPQNVCRRLSWVGETKVCVAIVLANARKADLGEATLAGNWLARKEVSITRVRDTATFPIAIVPPDWFNSVGLPTETTYYVEMLAEDFNQPCEQLPEMVKVYVNETVNQMLSRAEDSAAGRALVRSIFCDTAATILAVGFANIEPGTELVKNGVLQVVADRLSDATGLERTAITKMAKEPGASKLRALLQTETGLTKALASVSFRG